VIADGQKASDSVESLTTQFPALRIDLANRRRKLRTFVNFFLEVNNIRDFQGLDTPLKKSDELILIPSFAGG